MKILVLSNYYYPENFSITPLCENLAQQGHSVTVVTSYPQYGFPKRKGKDPRVSEEIINGVKVFRLKTASPVGGIFHRLIHYASFVVAAKRFLTNHKASYTLALAMSLSPLMSIEPILKFAKTRRIPVGLYCVDLWPASLEATRLIHSKGLRFHFLKRWSRKIYQGFDQILVGSDAFLPYLREHHRLTNVFPLVFYQPILPMNTPSTRDQHHPFELLYTGHLGRGHPLEKVLEVIEEQRFPIQVRVIGHGIAFNALQQKKRQYNWDFLTLQSPMKSEELGPYFQTADVMFVGLDLPSPVGDTMPHKLLQYMQQGKPVFGLLKGDGAHHLHASKGGWVLPPNARKDELKNVFQSILISSTEERQAMGKANQSYYDQHLKGDAVFHQFLSALNDDKKL